MLARPEAATPYAVHELTEAELLNLKPGPIQVVYPLDDEWNAAIEAAACTADEFNDPEYVANIVSTIRALKRSSPQKE